jgi:drug/metabolite transporter (DMT)-like permease
MMKRALRAVFKALAIVAGLVLVITPVHMQNYRRILLGALVVAAVCFTGWRRLDSDPEISEVRPPRNKQE